MINIVVILQNQGKKTKGSPKHMLALDKQNAINNLAYTLHNVQG
jgi:hypothetical protein